jgi:protein-L-isoaspartate(D-aspartate) O-methyltransferase
MATRKSEPGRVNNWLDKLGVPDFPELRLQMVARLSKAGGVSPGVLRAMAEIPRHAFAPPHLWPRAYRDAEVWGVSVYMARPTTIARVATALVESKARRVLEYGTGVGYTTAILAHLAEHVDTVGHHPWLLWWSSDAFRELRLRNISQKVTDGQFGWPERAPYDGIVVGAALPRLPRALFEQLTDSGVCIAPVGPYYGPHRLLAAQRTDDDVKVTDLGECWFPPLPGAWSLTDLWWPLSRAERRAPGWIGTGFWPIEDET